MVADVDRQRSIPPSPPSALEQRQHGTSQQYRVALRYFRQPQWTKAALEAKRVRSIVRLLALEERAIELGLGVLPARTMEVLRMLTGYRDVGRKLATEHRRSTSKTTTVEELTFHMPTVCPSCGPEWDAQFSVVGWTGKPTDAGTPTTLVTKCNRCGHEVHVGGQRP